MVNQKKFIEDIRTAQDRFPKLDYRIDPKGGMASIFGKIDIFDSTGVYWDTFDIFIRVGKNYPYEIPEVYERSKIIERAEKRHISNNGLCCVELEHKLLIQARRGIVLTDFLIKKVYPYLANQLFYNEKGYYVNDEWAHGFEGIIEFYQKELSIADYALAIRLIEIILTNKMPGRNDPCPCGERKYKDCHLNAVEQLQMVSKERLKLDLIEFKKLHLAE